MYFMLLWMFSCLLCKFTDLPVVCYCDQPLSNDHLQCLVNRFFDCDVIRSITALLVHWKWCKPPTVDNCSNDLSMLMWRKAWSLFWDHNWSFHCSFEVAKLRCGSFFLSRAIGIDLTFSATQHSLSLWHKSLELSRSLKFEKFRLLS